MIILRRWKMPKMLTVICLFLLALAGNSMAQGGIEVTGNIDIGRRPLSAVLDGKKKALYAVTDSDTLEVIDVKGGTLLKSMPLKAGLDPNMAGNAASLNPTTGRLYFPGERGDKVIVYSVRSDKVMTKIGSKRERDGYSTAAAADMKTGGFIKVDYAGFVSVYNDKNVLSYEFPIETRGQNLFSLSPDGERLYVMHQGNLLTVNIKERKVERESAAGTSALSAPFADQATGNVFLAGYDDAVYMVDREGKVSRVPLKSRPAARAGLDINRKTGHLFVPLADGSVEVLKVSQDGMKEVANVKVGTSPKVVVVDQDTGVVYVTTASGIAVLQDRE